MKALKCYYVLSTRNPSFEIGKELKLDDDMSDYKIADFGTNFDDYFIEAGETCKDYKDGYRENFLGKIEKIDRTKMKTQYFVLTSQRNIVRAILPINDFIKGEN
jgi:hypothetical protein